MTIATHDRRYYYPTDISGKMAPSLPWCIRRSRSSRCPSNVGLGVRLMSLGLVLRPLASAGPDREFLALWAVFLGRWFQIRGPFFEIRTSCQKAESKFRIVSASFVDKFHNRWLSNQIASDFDDICGQWKLTSRSFWRFFCLNPARSDRVDSNYGIAWQNQWSDQKVVFVFLCMSTLCKAVFEIDRNWREFESNLAKQTSIDR